MIGRGPDTDTLSGPRVRLRPVRLDDAPGIFSYASDPAVTEWLTFETHQALADSLEMAAWLQGAEGRILARIIEVEGRVAGCASLTPVPRAHRTAELGYVLHRAYWGRGLAVEAARLLMTFGFERLGLGRIEALCAVPNTRSLRVLEKLGMRREGTLREYRDFHGRVLDMHLYAVLKKEWHPPELARPPM